MNAKTKKAISNIALGKDVNVKDITDDTTLLISSDSNRASVFLKWNEGLIAKGKWYDLTPMQLPLAFIEVTKKMVAIEWCNEPENLALLGYYHENDKGLSTRIDDTKASKLASNETFELTIDSLIDKTIEPKNLKATTKAIYKIRRKFTKDVWDKKIKKWQKDAKDIEDKGEVEPKVKAYRSFVDTVAWNILGNPDEYNAQGYSGSLSRKLTNSKTSKIKQEDFDNLAIAFVEDVRKLEK